MSFDIRKISKVSYASWPFAFCLGLFALGFPHLSQGNGSDRVYHYELELSEDNMVCPHMLAVYNAEFREPWKARDWRKKLIGTPDDPEWEINEEFGPSGIYAFPKLPGVEHDPALTYEMRFSKLPSSPEFEAIEWREGRYQLEMKELNNIKLEPMLVAEFDIDNNGIAEIVIKTAFMHEYTTWGGWSSGEGGSDYIYVINKSEFVLDGIPTLKDIAQGQIDHAPPRYMVERQLRPFIIDGVAYVSQFEDIWPEVEGMSSQHRQYPIREYIHILQYHSTERTIGNNQSTALNMKPICRLRMIPNL
jgi:hypothetical protein